MSYHPTLNDAIFQYASFPQLLTCISADKSHPFRIIKANDAATVFLAKPEQHLFNFNIATIIEDKSLIPTILKKLNEQEKPVNAHDVRINLPHIQRSTSIYLTAVLIPSPLSFKGSSENNANRKSDKDVKYALFCLVDNNILSYPQGGNKHENVNASSMMVSLSSLLAHEIKNPLAGIRGAGQLLFKYLHENGGNEDEINLCNIIMEESDRVVSLLDKVGSFSTFDAPQCENLNIHEILNPLIKAAKVGYASHVHIQEIYDPSLPNIYSNKNYLQQIFSNILKNAAEAIHGTPNAFIEVKTFYKIGKKRVRQCDDKAVSTPISPISIRFFDNGKGISDENMSRIFTPFFTTKAHNTGLGLSLVKKMVEDLKGSIDIYKGVDATPLPTPVTPPLFATGYDGNVIEILLPIA